MSPEEAKELIRADEAETADSDSQRPVENEAARANEVLPVGTAVIQCVMCKKDCARIDNGREHIKLKKDFYAVCCDCTNRQALKRGLML